MVSSSTHNSSDKIKILYYGDAPSVSTGFATVSRNILMPLHNSGKYDITVLGVNHYGEPHSFPFPIWPVFNNPERDPYGRELVKQQIAQMDFDILFMIQDSFILDFVKEYIPALRLSHKPFKNIIYFPIDGIPKPSWIEAMAVADCPVSYTKFAFDECARAFPSIKDKLQIIPHGINPNDFYPIPYREMLSFRRSFFGPLSDKFIFTNVNRNQQRKDIPRFLMAFKKLHEKYPDTLAYCHMAIRDQGWNLDEVCKAIGLEINKDIVFPHNFGPNKGFPVQILNKIYNASDVVVTSTLGEGFGLGQLEAMAAKVPIISPRNTACTEIVGEDRGLLVDSGHDLEHFTVLPHDNEVVRPIISVQDMVDKMEILYKDEVIRMRLAENGYKWVTDNLLWEKHVVPMWEHIFTKAVESLKNEKTDEKCLSGALEV
jgi:glycosyltransferase involved in cell wall biosynthesis